MSQEIIFHPWIKFDFNADLKITHDHNRKTAVANTEGVIVVWDEHGEVMGPQLKSGKAICIILGQFDSVEQLLWIQNSDKLMIKDGEMIFVWDIIANEPISEFQFSHSVLFMKSISMGWLIVAPDGKALLYDNRVIWENPNPASFVADIPKGVILYPFVFREEQDNWEEIELVPNRTDRRIKRKIEDDNDIDVGGEVYYFGKTDNPNLVLEESHKHLFDEAEIIVVYGFETGSFVVSESVGVFVGVKGTTPVTIPMVPAVCEAVLGKEHYFVITTSQAAYRVSAKFDKMVIESLASDLRQAEVLLEKVPPSFFLDFDQDIIYARTNLERGLLWYPDYIDDQIFLDLFTREGSIFAAIDRNRNSYVEVDEEVTYLLDWRRGKSYPSGTLYFRNLLHPEDEPLVLYDEHLESKRISNEEFRSSEHDDFNFPLIIPEWHKLELAVLSTAKEFTLDVSLSQYFCLLEEWSKHEEVEKIDFPEIEDHNSAYIRFGHLIDNLAGQSVNLENICPLWTVNQKAKLLAMVSTDSFGYVLDLSTRFLLPVYSFQATIPLHLRLTDDGQYLIFTYFSLEKTNLKTHPSDENVEYLDLKFPYFNFEVHNIVTKQRYKRAFRFPHHLIQKNIWLDISSKEFTLTCPSYTDIKEVVICSFEVSSQEFHLINSGEHKRYWNTFSYRSPHAQYEKGLEFPLVAHPEIYREYTMRPCHVYEYMMVRKSDDMILSSASGHLERVDQVSSSDIHNLAGRVELVLPFYYNQSMKSIFVDQKFAKHLKGHTRYPLEKIEHLPSYYSIEFDLTISDIHILKRLSKFISTIIQNKEVHSPRGIAYESTKFDIYRSQLEIQQEAINTAIDFIREV